MVYLARALELRDGDRGALEALTRGKASTATVALRARTVLLAADGMPNIQIEKITGFSAPTVLKWRNRYAEGGIEALSDVQRPGREREIDELALIADTLTNDGNPPAELGISHWSARIMAERHGISFSSVARIWRRWKIQPHRIETFKFSTDPALEVLTGKLSANAFYLKHTNIEFVDFLGRVADAHPGVELHVICDNY
ncbi:transposase [Arthrobacter sp. UYNi723]